MMMLMIVQVLDLIPIPMLSIPKMLPIYEIRVLILDIVIASLFF